MSIAFMCRNGSVVQRAVKLSITPNTTCIIYKIQSAHASSKTRINTVDCLPKEHCSDLFNYTSGRWLYNEPLRLSERQLPFHVAELKRIAAESVGRQESDVFSFKKLAEGGFNRTFEVTMRDGFQVVARLPYPITEPRHYTVASEVATMDFVRLFGLPVPRVFTYSATNENPVGTEYMIMEKVSGNELGNLWYTMTEDQRLKIVFQIVKLETLLFSIRLSGYGSVYYKRDLPPVVHQVDLEAPGMAGSFCIGPDAHYKWWHKERSSLSFNRGPFSCSEELLESVAKRELAWMEKYAHPRFPSEPLHRELYGYRKLEPADHIRSLREYLRVARLLSPEQGCALNRPIIRHPDLQPNNIFVSDSFDIVALIDWQHCSILPLFLQAGPPRHFQNYGDDESERLIKPRLPANFHQLGENDQQAAREVFRLRQIHYYYFAATAKFNKDHLDACLDNQVVLKQKLFQHAGDPWEGDNIALKADLIRMSQQWQNHTVHSTGKDSNCPLQYSSQEIEECFSLEAEQQEANEDIEKSRNCLGVAIDGWVPHDRYVMAKEMSENFKAEAIAMADSEETAVQIKNHWPFDDRDEDG